MLKSKLYETDRSFVLHRIVRNKAAERAKIQAQTHQSPPPGYPAPPSSQQVPTSMTSAHVPQGFAMNNILGFQSPTASIPSSPTEEQRLGTNSAKRKSTELGV